MANPQFHITRQNREVFIRLLDGLSIEQLNEIPEGFNNNIAWNFGHIVVGQQTICYLRAGLPLLVDKDYVNRYQRGSKPEAFISKEEIAFLKEQAIALTDRHEQDWEAGLFTQYEAFTSSMGVRVATCEEALHYAGGHDQLHFGYAWAQRRLILFPSHRDKTPGTQLLFRGDSEN
jgi:hypothetical protein